MISAVLTSDPVLNTIRKELRKLREGLKVELDEIGEVISSQIIKREVLENESTSEALGMLKKANRKAARITAKKNKLKNAQTAVPVPEEIDFTYKPEQERKVG